MRPESHRPVALFRAIERASHDVTHHLAAVASSLSMTEPEAHLLAHLANRSPTPVADLQRSFGFPPSTLTNILDRLEGRGLVARKVNPEDRRSFLLVLTSSGERTAAKVRDLLSRLEDSIKSRVSEADLAGFFAVLRAIEDGVENPHPHPRRRGRP